MISFEDDIGMPDMSYGWAKLTCEYLAAWRFEKHGLNSVCYRPFSGYGEDQDNAYPFPSICRRAIDSRGAAVLEVWGAARKCETLSTSTIASKACCGRWTKSTTPRR